MNTHLECIKINKDATNFTKKLCESSERLNTTNVLFPAGSSIINTL